jgi:hypothetical protein
MNVFVKEHLRKRIIYFLFVILFISFTDYYAKEIVNTSHLDHLYELINVNGNKLGIIHIYSEYPDYKWVGDEDEGISCVDDVARAAIFYIQHYKFLKEESSYKKAKSLIRFVLYMQAENGFFYNFMLPDYSINKTFKTSIAEPNWWSWRALWALVEAKGIFKDDKRLNKKIDDSIQKILVSTKNWLSNESTTVKYSGFELPTWLPFESAADQSALIVKSLCLYYKKSKDLSVLSIIKKLSDGILMMQTGDKNDFPFSCFLSWQNTWHGWGNNQSEVLLLSAETLKDSNYLQAALNEIKYFYPYLVREKYLSNFVLSKDSSGSISILKKEKYSQIAYEISPIVHSSLKAFEITKDIVYAQSAVDAVLWFFGKNILNKPMYDQNTGRCFDGIISETKLNQNSGAESTIEALLALISIEKNPTSRKILFDTMDCY